MALFVCPGICEDCGEKNCPMRGEIDEGFKKELAEQPMGKMKLREYERLKKDISPEFVAWEYLPEIRQLIEKTRERRNRLEEVLETDIVERMRAIVKAAFPENFKLDERDQIPKRFFYCAGKVAEQIYKLVNFDCNTLFCGDCCILPACDQSVVKKI